MELRQLEYFVAVVDEGGFTRAAEKVRVAQPGVSAQVRRLERELGQPLLERTSRRVRLTEAGAAVLPHARAALAAVAAARDAVDELTGLLRGHVAVGTVTSHPVDLPGLLAAFHRDHPAVEITLSEATSAVLVDGLLAGTLDAAIVSAGAVLPDGVLGQVITDQAVVAAVAHDHELADRPEIPVAALAGRDLISLPPGTGLRARLEEACAAAGFRPRVAFEASDPEVLADLAAHGLGAALLPAEFAAARAARLRSVPLTDPTPRGRLMLAWRGGGPSGPAGRAFLARARAAVADRTPGPPSGEPTADIGRAVGQSGDRNITEG
ncbi:LysR family transcriptional regulator [Actinophytocola xanthii]|uniref:LysR family transcriptional regulator n=1 Tax=Actinophytocola xanthii TaxID=1912961 RepID=UPI0009F81D00|nr:LysR family transcriptional regulator [Actinophytocola xanthii]